MIRLRFHLGAGKHHRQWQVRHPDGRVEYYDPSRVRVRLRRCRLRNRRATAMRIHNGEHKAPCAWVEAESVEILPPSDLYPTRMSEKCLHYDPRVAPHWRDCDGQDIDGERYCVVETDERWVFGYRMVVN